MSAYKEDYKKPGDLKKTAGIKNRSLKIHQV